MKSFYAYGWIVFATNKVAGSPQVKGILATEESAENEKKVLEANTGGVYFSVSRLTINQPEKLNVQPLGLTFEELLSGKRKSKWQEELEELLPGIVSERQ